MTSKSVAQSVSTSVRFDDLAEQINDRVDDPTAAGVDRYVGLEHLDPGSLRITRWGSPNEVSAQKLRFHPGDIIFGKRRAYQRKVAVADFEGICSAHAMVLRERHGVVAPGFLPHFMASNAFMSRAVQISVGSLSPTINWSTLRDQEFDLPSLEEQGRLVRVLQPAAHNVNCYEHALGKAHITRQLLVDQWVERHLAPRVETNVPTGRISVGQLFQSIVDRGHRDIPMLAVTVAGEIVPRDALGRHVSDESGPEKCLRVQGGDLAYNTMRLWQGSIGATVSEGLLSPAYTVLRQANDPLKPALWVEVFRSAPLLHEYRKLVRGIAKDRWRIYFADLATITFEKGGIASLDALETISLRGAEIIKSLGVRLAAAKALYDRFAGGVA